MSFGDREIRPPACSVSMRAAAHVLKLGLDHSVCEWRAALDALSWLGRAWYDHEVKRRDLVSWLPNEVDQEAGAEDIISEYKE